MNLPNETISILSNSGDIFSLHTYLSFSLPRTSIIFAILLHIVCSDKMSRFAWLAGDKNWLGRGVKIVHEGTGHPLKKNQNNGLYEMVEDGGPDKEGSLFKRQNSGCNTYGLDFQDGGNYFINTNSNASFTFVSSFVGCQNDTASVMLINQSTGDQYDCGSVPTVPDNAPELATCPVLKDQIASGDFLIIAVGNNGNGTPFAFQREFNISAGPQQTITSYYTPTVTSTPIVITTCKLLPTRTSTSFVVLTSTL